MKYFVLNPRSKVHDDPFAKASRKAMRAYAHSIGVVDVELSTTLLEWANKESDNDIYLQTTNQTTNQSSGLLECMDKKIFGFGNILAIIEALLDKRSDDTPLRDLMPGDWPTLGDLRELVASQPVIEDGRADKCHCTGWRHNENGICLKCGAPAA